MRESNLKNMVVLSNLPSNIVDEAIVILKNKKHAKKLEKINNNKYDNNDEKIISKDYILKEAEMLISNYISDVEDEKNKESFHKKDVKYKRMKKYSIFLTLVVFIESLFIFF